MITISLCMIVKNEEAVLERLLRTMSTVADRIHGPDKRNRSPLYG